MANFNNINGIENWSREELEEGLKYYELTLLTTYDNVAIKWLVDTINVCEQLLNPRESSWIDLFN